MRALNVFLALGVSLLLALCVLELGLRLIGMAPPRTINRFDPVLGWSKKPDATTRRSTREYDVTLAINALGLRDDPMTDPARPENTFRVLCLGDSFTLGYVVAREDLFVDQLEGWWKSENRRVDVVNAGSEGYSTDQEVVWLRQHGDEFQPDLVLLFPYDNDIYWNVRREYFGKPKPRFRADGTLEERELADPGERGWFGRTALGNLLGSVRAGGGGAQEWFVPDDGEKRILKEFGVLLATLPAFITDAVTRTGGALAALKAKCDQLGARLVVAPIPSHSAIDPEFAERFGKRRGLAPDTWSPQQPFEIFLRLCRENGIETLDCREHLRARAADHALYFQADWHLNPDGNRAFAEFLLAELGERLQVFPAAHSAISPGAFPAPADAGRVRTWPKVFALLWVLLTALYWGTYRDEKPWQPPLKVFLMLAAIFAIVLGGGWLIGTLPPIVAQAAAIVFVVALLGFIAYKLGRRVGTILELFKSFTLRGHWYLMPLVVVLLSIGSLLVVAASSPLVAPFIYTLF